MSSLDEEPIHMIPRVDMPLPAAAALAQHVKAALLHLGVADDIAEANGIELDGPDGPWVTGADRIGPLLRRARQAIEDLDLWAILNAGHQGGTGDIYASTERWCHRRGGGLPESAFLEDEDPA